MKTIEVGLTEGEKIEFPADDWGLSDEGDLNIYREEVIVGMVRRGFWVYVIQLEPKQ